jgi:hypothetical protein
MMGGSLSVESRLGAGSEFTVRLPGDFAAVGGAAEQPDRDNPARWDALAS